MKKCSTVFLAALTASLLSILYAPPSVWAQTARKTHHAAKQIVAKHPPMGHLTQAGTVRPARPQGGGLPDLTPEQMQDASDGMRRLSDSSDLAGVADADVARGDWAQASIHYKQALSLWPGNDNALYGLGKCADTAGDMGGAISYYRKAIYTTNPRHYGIVPGDGYDTNNVMRLMEFVLLLSNAGQKQEALAVYHRAAFLLNYEDADVNGGKPYLKVLLPTLDSSPDAPIYTLKSLQAMAHVGLAVYSQDDKEKLAHLDAAIKLQPDMPQAYFYKGETLWGKPHRSREALASYLTARRLSYVDTQLLIDHVIKDTDVEKMAALEQGREKQKAGAVPGAGAATK